MSGPYAASHGCRPFFIISAIPIRNHAALISGSSSTAARYAAIASSHFPCFLSASPSS